MKLHDTLIGGSVPRAEKQPNQAALLAATEALDTERVHMLTSSSDTHVFYLAAPSRELTDGVVTTPLAAALPGHPSHMGDGCYVHYYGADDAVLAVKRGDTLRVLSNSADAINAAAAEEELPLVDVSAINSTAWRLETESGKALRAGNKLAQVLQTGTLLWALGAALVSAGLLVTSGARDKTSELQAMQNQQLVDQLQLSQPLAGDMEKLAQLSALAVKNRGWIELYKQDAGGVAFAVRLPNWVSKSVIDSLGPDVKTEYDPKADNIFAYVGDVQPPSAKK